MKKVLSHLKTINNLKLPSIIFILVSFFIYSISILIRNASKGLDITDESFYLLSAQQAHSMEAQLTQFGFYTRFLFTLARGDIALFRILGFFVICMSALLISITLINYINSLQKTKCNSWYFYSTQIISALTMMTAILAYYSSWLPTPSYNWFTTTTICWIASCTLFYSSHQYPNFKHVFLCSILIGISGCLAFMAKPTSALVGAIAVFIWIILQPYQKKHGYFLLLGAFFALFTMCLHALFFLDGLHNFYKRINLGLEMTKILGGHNLFELSKKSVDIILKDIALTLKLPGISLGTIVAIIALIIQRRNKFNLAKYFCFISLFVIILCQGFAVFYLFFLSGSPSAYPRVYDTTKLIYNILHYFIPASILSSKWKYDSFIGERGLIFSLSIAYVTMVLSYIGSLKTLQAKGSNYKKQISLILFFFLLSLAPGVGTNGNILTKGSFVFFVSIVLVPTIWLALKSKNIIFLSTISTIVAWATITNVDIGLRSPYRLVGGLRNQNIPIEFFTRKPGLEVDKKTADYINLLKHLASKEGWQAGCDLIDLTGGTPGASLILEAKVMTTPWFLGGYKGSDIFTKKALSFVNKERLKNAWILTAPAGKIKINEHILKELGLDFPNSYKKLGELVTGYRNEKQFLYKPKQETKHF